MWVMLLLLSVVTPAPQPSPGAPLKTITNAHSTPFCTAFENNIRRGVQGVLVNDELFKRSGPVFSKAAHDMTLGGGISSSFNSMHPAQSDQDNPATTMDMSALDALGGAIVNNLQTIDRILNDSSRFPAPPKTQEDRQLAQLRTGLLALAKKQNDELNVISGTTNQYIFDSLLDRYPSPADAEGVTGPAAIRGSFFDGGPLKSPSSGASGASAPANVSKKLGTNQTVLPANVTPLSGDPELLNNNMFMNSPIGRLYGELVRHEAEEMAMQPAFTQALTQASQGCK